jgi:hypothetical protein
VTFGTQGGPSATTPVEAEPVTEHEAVLVGVPQEREIEFQIAAQADSGAYLSEPQGYSTGTIPLDLPDLRMLVGSQERAAEALYLATTFTFTSALLLGEGLVTLADGQGQVLWAVAGNFVPRARLAPGGQGVVYLSQGGGEAGVFSVLREVSWTGEVLREVAPTDAQRDFAILDDGSIAVLVRDDREVEGYDEDVVGDAVMLVRPDGSMETTWSVFDQLGPGFCSRKAEDSTDWSHAAFLEWWPEQGLLLVVLRDLQAIVALDPYTGEQAWLLSEYCGDFVNEDGGPLLVYPHSVMPTPDGLLIFNQGEHVTGCSGVVELAFDPAAPGVHALWSWEDPACRYSGFMGNAQPLPGGDTLVAMDGLVREIAPDGAVLQETYAGLDVEFGYVERVEGLYPP